MAEEFQDYLVDRFDEILNRRPLSKLGATKGFDFDKLLHSLRIWDIVEDREAALFSLKSQNWSGTILRMLNDTNASIGSMAERRPIEDAMRKIVGELRPILDEKWSAYVNGTSLDEEFLDEVTLPADFMGFCREELIRRKGYQVRGAFSDLFSIYAEGFVPCGWDGEFPNGTLLVF